MVRIYSKPGSTDWKAAEVRPTPPSTPSPLFKITLLLASRLPYVNAPSILKIIITKAVIVQITTVSMKGSNNATIPSEAGYLVFTAECAIAADPAPASFENAAR